jgi:hypothetical protein
MDRSGAFLRGATAMLLAFHPLGGVGLGDHELFGVAGGVAEADEVGKVRGPVPVGAPSGVLGELGLVGGTHFSAPWQGCSSCCSAPPEPGGSRPVVADLGDFRVWACNRYLA